MDSHLDRPLKLSSLLEMVTPLHLFYNLATVIVLQIATLSNIRMKGRDYNHALVNMHALLTQSQSIYSLCQAK